MVLRKPQQRGEEARRDILVFIHEYWNAEGISPSIRDIALGLDMNISNVHHHLGVLVDEGSIQMRPHRARSIQRI